MNHLFIKMFLMIREYTYNYEREKPDTIFEGDPCCDCTTLKVIRDRLGDFLNVLKSSNMYDYIWIDIEYSKDKIDYY